MPAPSMMAQSSALEFREPRPEPEGAEGVRDADVDFAAHRRHRAVACSHEAKRGFFHWLGSSQDLRAFGRRTNSVDTPRDQNRTRVRSNSSILPTEIGAHGT